jgi:hypothetical protein
VRFTCFTGTVGTLRLLLPLPPSLRMSGGPTAAPGTSLPRAADARRAGREDWGSAPPLGRHGCPWRQTGLPGSRGTLVGARSVLRPRQDRTRQAVTACRRGPRLCQGRGLLRRGKLSGLHRRARPPRCLRFAAGVSPGPRKTRFRLLAGLYRAGWVARRVPTKGFRVAIVTSHPPFPSFPGAMTPMPLLICPETAADHDAISARPSARLRSR